MLTGAVVPFQTRVAAAQSDATEAATRCSPWVRNVAELRWVTFEDGHVAEYHEEPFDDTTPGLER